MIKNGKLTGLVIVLVLIAVIIAFFAISILLILNNKFKLDIHDTNKWWGAVYFCGGYILFNGMSAMVRRGWTFWKEILNHFSK